jgi:hypothetical protein
VIVTGAPKVDVAGSAVTVVLVAALLTAWSRTADVEPRHPAVLLGANDALTGWLPTDNAVAVTLAVPEASVSTSPQSVPPLEKVITPRVQTAGVTVAVKVTGWPNADGFGDEVKLVLVPARFTTCCTVFDVDPAQSSVSLGANAAVTEWFPANRSDVVNLATPDSIAAVSSAVLPSLNVTVPAVQAAADEVTVAVNVTDWPKVDGLADELSDVAVLALFTSSDRASDVEPVHEAVSDGANAAMIE